MDRAIGTALHIYIIPAIVGIGSLAIVIAVVISTIWLNVHLCVIIIHVSVIVVIRFSISYIHCGAVRVIVIVVILWIIGLVINLVVSAMHGTIMCCQREVIVAGGAIHVAEPVETNFQKQITSGEQHVEIGMSMMYASFYVSHFVAVIVIVNGMLNIIWKLPGMGVSVRSVKVLSLRAYGEQDYQSYHQPCYSNLFHDVEFLIR